MKVLIACEESQTVCAAFRRRGHEAYSCDIQEPSGGHPEWHILGDAVPPLRGGQLVTMDDKCHYIDAWDLLIAHPPCTYLSNAGARHLWKGHVLQPDRVMKGIEGRDLFMRFWWADIPRICVENPIPSRVFCLPPLRKPSSRMNTAIHTAENLSLAQKSAATIPDRYCGACGYMVSVWFLRT